MNGVAGIQKEIGTTIFVLTFANELLLVGIFFYIMQILKELEVLIPSLTSEEFKQLERNILEEGIRDPLVTWNGILVDGHNRYRIAQEYDIDFVTVEKEFADMNAVKEWMINNQFGRRNLPAYERGKLALRLKDIYSQKAKETKAEKVSHYRQTGEVCQISDKPDTKRDLAKIANISHDTINKIEKIEAKASDDVKQKLSIGTMSINEAYKEIKKEEKKVERVELIQKQIEDIEEGLLPDLVGLFDVVSVDPPWPYEGDSKNITSFDSVGRRVANPYPEMSIEQIKAIELPLMENAVVLLWTTHKFLPDAFEILKEWNLDYKATLVWNKEKIGMGAWFRMQCEFCLVGIKGKPYWENTTYRDIIIEARREHSRKPDSFFEMIEKITMGNRLEYFSREKREGWQVFGNDINKF